MNVLIIDTDLDYCQKLEALLYSSRLKNSLEVRIINEAMLTQQNLAGFKPDILICRPDPDDAKALKSIPRIFRHSPLCKIIAAVESSGIEIYRWALESGVYRIVEGKDSIPEIISLAVKLEKIIKKEESQTFANDQFKRFISFSSHKMKCELLRYLIRDYIPGKRFWDYPDIIDYSDYVANSCTCITVCFDWLELEDHERYSMQFDLEKIITDSYLERLDIPSTFINESTLCIVISKKAVAGGFSVNRFRDIIQKALKGRYRYSIGISDPCNINEIGKGSRHSFDAAMLSFYNGWNRIYYYESDLGGLDEDIIDYSDLIMGCAKDNDLEKAAQYGQQMYQDIMARHKYKPQEVTALMFNVIAGICMLFGIKMPAIFETVNKRKYIILKELNEILNICFNEASGILRGVSTLNSGNRRINSIIQYIEENYIDRKLSVGSIAKNNYLSRNYLCTLFKRKTGMTVNAYIIKLRIEKSCQLLEDRNKKLYDIAYESGFSDPNYFSTVFKKQTGLSPTEYRLKRDNSQ